MPDTPLLPGTQEDQPEQDLQATPQAPDDQAPNPILQAIQGQAPTPSPTTQPTPEPAVPNLNFANEYEKNVLNQYKNLTPENIYKSKVQQYFDALGVKNDGSFMSKLAQFGNEYRKVKEAHQLGVPYLTPAERLHHETSQTYTQMLPQLQKEASDIFKTIRERENNAGKLAVQQEKNKVAYYATDSKEKIAQDRNDIMRLVREAEAGKIDSQTELLDKQNKIVQKQIDAGLAALPKELQGPMAMAQLYQSDPELFGSMLKTTSQMTAAKMKPSDTGAYANAMDQYFPGGADNFIKRFGEIEKFKNIYKPKPTGANQNTVVYSQEPDADGNIVNVPKLLNKGTGGITDVAGIVKPDPKRLETDKNLGAAKGQAEALVQTIANAIRSGKSGAFLGPEEGNPLSVALRGMGYNGTTKGPEAISDFLGSNMTGLHARGIVGGRVPMQMYDKLESTNYKKYNAADAALAKALGSYYAIDFGKELNNGRLKDADITGEHMKAITDAIDQMVKQSHNPNAGPIVLPGNLDIRESLKNKRANEVLPQKKPLTGQEASDWVNKNLKK